jgi:SLT domain-containing protein/phage-related protein
MASSATLGFSILSRYHGGGMAEARRDIVTTRAAIATMNGDLDRQTRFLDKIPMRWRAIGLSAAAVAPAMLPIGAAALQVSGAFTAMAAGVGAALGVYGAALKGAISRTMEMAKAGKALSPVQKEFVSSVDGMKNAWQRFIRETTNQTLQPATHAVKGLTAGIGLLKPLLDAVHPSLVRVAKDFESWMKGDRARAYRDILAGIAKTSMPHLVTAGKAVLNVLGDGFRAFAPLAEGVAKAIERGALALNKWSDGGGFQRFLEYVKGNGPAVRQFFDAFWAALGNVMRILGQFSSGSLHVLTDAMRAIAALDPGGVKAFAMALLLVRSPVAFLILNCPPLRDLMIRMLGAMDATVVYTFGGALLALRIAFLAMNTALLTTPFGWVIIGITALVAAIVLIATKTTWFQTAWTYTWNFIKTVAGAIWDFLGSKWGWFIGLIGPVGWLIAIGMHWSQVWNAIKLVATTVWGALVTAWNAVTGALALAWTTVSTALITAWNTVWNALRTAAQAVWTGLTAAWNLTVQGFATIWNAVSSALTTAWNAVWNALRTAAQAVWTAMQTAWNAVCQAFTTVWNAVSSALTTAWNAVWNALRTAAQAVWTAMQTAWNVVCQAFTTAWNAVSGALTTAWNAVWNALRTAAEAVWNALRTAWQAVLTAMNTAWSTFWSAFRAAWDTAWNAAKTAAEAVWNALKTAWQAILNAVNAAWGAFWSAFRAAWDTAWNAAKTAAEAVWNALKTAWQAVLNAVKTIWSTFWAAFREAWDTAWNAAKNAANVVWNWLKDRWGEFTSGIDQIWDKFSGAFKKAWESTWNTVKSVANKVWHEIGEIIEKAINAVISIVNGLIKGFNAITSFLKIDVKIDDVKKVNFNFADGGMVGLTPYMVGGMAEFSKGGAVNLKRGGTLRGYAPGRDTVPAMLSKGEGVLTPEAVRGLGGSGFVHAANRKWAGHRGAGKGGHPDRFFANGGMVGALHFAGGGIVPEDVAAALARAGVSKGLVTQGSHNAGGVAASAGTHDGGGVVDLGTTSKDVLARLLQAGFAAWTRGPEQGMSPHIHAVLINGKGLSPQAAAQVQDFLKGGDGLGVGGGGGGVDVFGFLKGHVGKILKNVYKGLSPLADVGGAVADFFGFGDDEDDGGLFGTGIGPDVGPNVADAVGDVVGKVTGADSIGGQMMKMLGQVVLSMLDKGSIAEGLSDAGDKFKKFGGIAGGFGEVALGMGKKILDEILPDFLMGEKEKAGPMDFAMGVGGGVNKWSPLAMQALVRAGISPSQLGAFLALMQSESGGNPLAMNNWDSNAAKGQASRGLMQVIPSTFAAYRDPSLPNNIFDPLANMVAAARYIKARYGGKVPGSPYANGTSSATPGLHLVGEQGPEMVAFGGGEKVFTASQTSSMLNRPPQGVEASLRNRSFEDVAAASQYMAFTVKKSWDKVVSDSTTGWTTLTPVLGEVGSNYGTDVPAAIEGMRSKNASAWADMNATSATHWGMMRDATLADMSLQQGTVIPVTTGVMQTSSDAAWSGMATNSATSWTSMEEGAYTPLQGALTGVPASAGAMQTSSDAAWSGMAAGSAASWTSMEEGAYTPLQGALAAVPGSTGTMQTASDTAWNGMAAGSVASYGTMEGEAFSPLQGTMTDGVPGAAETMQTGVSTQADTMKNNIVSASDTSISKLNDVMSAMDSAVSKSASLAASGVGGGGGSKSSLQAAADSAAANNDMLLAGGWKLQEDGSWRPPAGGGTAAERAAANSASDNNDMLLAAGWTLLEDGTWKTPSGYAKGTSSATPGLHLVGEKGPELVGLHGPMMAAFSGGQSVLPANKTASLLNGGIQSIGGQEGLTLPQGETQDLLNQGGFQGIIDAAKKMAEQVGAAWREVNSASASEWSAMRDATLAESIARYGTEMPSAATTMQTTSNAAWLDMNLQSATQWGLMRDTTFMEAELHQGTTMPTTATTMQTTSNAAWLDMNLQSATQWGLMRDTTFMEAELHQGTTMPLMATTMQTASNAAWLDMQIQSTTQYVIMRDGVLLPLEDHLGVQLPTAAETMNVEVSASFTSLQATVTAAMDAGIAKMDEFITKAQEAIEKTAELVAAVQEAQQAMATLASAGSGAAGGTAGAGVAGNVESWRPLALEAMAAGGLDPSQIDAFLALMQAESGGDPNAINNWDSNAAAGTPSIGLMQVIQPTFDAHNVTGGDIHDPFANMAAAAAYIKSRYGGIVPGSPYENGTPFATPGVHLVGENGPELVGLNGPEYRLFAGGESVLPSQPTITLITALDQTISAIDQFIATADAGIAKAKQLIAQAKAAKAASPGALGGSLADALARAGVTPDMIIQGPFSTSVAASAGTHSGDGVVDVPADPALLQRLIAAGFAAWMRGNGDGMEPHIHAVQIGNPGLSPQAAWQVQDFLRGGTGLNIPAMAHGTRRAKQGWHLMGERGPELVAGEGVRWLQGGEKVMSNYKLKHKQWGEWASRHDSSRRGGLERWAGRVAGGDSREVHPGYERRHASCGQGEIDNHNTTPRGGHEHGECQISMPITVQGNLDEGAVQKLKAEVLPQLNIMLKKYR